MARPVSDVSGQRMPSLSLRVPLRHHALMRRIPKLLQQPAGEAAVTRLVEADPPPAPVGRFRNEAAALAFLADAIYLACKPRAVWLFGSRARGTAREDSDIDLMVVIRDGRDTDIAVELVRATAAGGLAVDLLVCTESEFADCAHMSGTIIEAVHREGRRIYADRDTLLQERGAAA